MSELRARKPGASPAAPAPKQEEDDKPKTRKSAPPAPPDLEPNPIVLGVLFVLFTLVVGGFLYYKVDNSQDGEFATWVNTKFPAFNELIHGNHFPLVAANAQEVALSLTEEALKEYDGTDADKAIYLAINGTIYDVSASPAFYGPGGHYHHFVGKDATRAWVTECWDKDDQFTWRMDDVEIMFMPKWMDEEFENVAEGRSDIEEEIDPGNVLSKGALAEMAQKAVERLGTVSAKVKAKRREEDKVEADAQVRATVLKWTQFFESNPKYSVAGKVIRDESRPPPPRPCAKAFEKRPIKYGKLDKFMGNLGDMGGLGQDENRNAQIPNIGKEQGKKTPNNQKSAKDTAHEEL